jgi:tetratricopeptide (TPR) repeat protein
VKVRRGFVLAIAVAAFVAARGVAVGAADTGVIRLAEPKAPSSQDDSAERPAADPMADARRGFDVQAFDGRLLGLWFQRKAYARQGRDQDAAHQSEMIRDFVAEEGVRRLDVPAGALLLESDGWLKEGNYDRALATLSLAEALDPGRPQIALGRARVLWASGAGIFAAGTEAIKALRASATIAARDLTLVHESALVGVAVLLGFIALFAVFQLLRHQVALRHDVEEWLASNGKETWAKAGGWAVLLAPLIFWVGAGWAVFYWIAATYRYGRRGEKAMGALLLVAAALVVPAYRFSVGLYGLAADPTVRTTIEAANGGYDPDRIVKLRELVDSHPGDPMYRFLLAGLYKNGRYFEESFQEYKRVLEAAPSTYQARINLGNIYFLLGQYGEAISNYRKALDIRPDSVLAYYDMYLAQSESFKLREAGESLTKARAIDPEESNRLLTGGSRAEGGAKVVDAAIDFGSIWRATVEGRHLREWLDAGPVARSWRNLARGLLNPISLAALLALVACVGIAGVLHGRQPAQRCLRCGRPFCAACASAREGHTYCNQCVHLFVLGDGLAPETKSMKLYEIERHERWNRRGRRAASVVLPGARQLMAGHAWAGGGLVILWLMVWVGGFPSVLGVLERGLGLGIHLAELRPETVPGVFAVDAALLFAVPLGVLVWLAGNVTIRRARGA